MANCCNPSSNFPNAATMQQIATNNPIIWTEISLIQQAIMSAASLCSVPGGQMCATVAGNTPMTFVSGLSSVSVLNGGSGYYIDTPSIRFISPNSSPSGTGATATVVTNGGNILQINMNTGGSGYQPVQSTLDIITSTGSNAVIEPLVDASGRIISVNIVNSGINYDYTDTIVAIRALDPNPYYVDAVFQISNINSSTGAIVGVQVLNSGSGYEPAVTQAEIVSSLDSSIFYPVGSGFTGTVLTNSLGAITGVQIQSGGAGYVNLRPYLQINDPGTGAITEVNLTGTTVSSVDVINSGNNYTQTATGTIYNPETIGSPNPPSSAAVVDLNISNNIYNTDPTLYWQVWAGAATDKAIDIQLNTVMSYFTNLGYTVVIQSNPTTNNTIQWKICW
jgi:hypothetical protein